METKNKYQQYKEAVGLLPDANFIKATALRILSNWGEDQDEPDFDKLYIDAFADLGIKLIDNSAVY